MTRSLVISVALLAAMTGSALADTIDNRQANQMERIHAARKSGELTRQEDASLRHEQARVAELERRIKADGVVTRREARVMDRVQDAANRHIYQETHDNDKSWRAKWR